MFENECKLDVVLKPNEISFLKKEKIAGVYVLFVKKEPMYVGQSMNLFNRLYTHLRKQNITTSFIADEIDEIGIQFVKEPLTNEPSYIEMAYIFEYSPPLNTRRNKWFVESMLTRHFKSRCNKCNRIAHQNGFCYYHGGNGVTATMLVKEEMNNIFVDDIQLKLII